MLTVIEGVSEVSKGSIGQISGRVEMVFGDESCNGSLVLLGRCWINAGLVWYLMRCYSLCCSSVPWRVFDARLRFQVLLLTVPSLE